MLQTNTVNGGPSAEQTPAASLAHPVLLEDQKKKKKGDRKLWIMKTENMITMCRTTPPCTVAQLESGVSRPHAQLRPDQTRSSPRLKAPRASSLPSGLGSVRPRCPVGANPFPSGRQGEKTGCASERSPPLSWGTRAPYSPLERLSPHGRTRLYDLAAPPTGGQAFSYPKRHEFSKRKSLLSCKHPRKPPRTTRHLGRGQSRGVDKFSKMQGEAEGLTLPCRHLLGLSPPGG